MTKSYRKDLDVIKGMAIIAVILFHLGIVKSGYLGVDAFLVINGFLIIPSVFRNIVSRNFSFVKFLKKRILRLWPMVIVATFVCLLIGYIGMLPDDYENIGESVVASNLFSENILLSITTKDYWNASNEYNPLMHLWYVGILFEFYVLYPLIMIGGIAVARLFNADVRRAFIWLTISLCILSLLFYNCPFISSGDKFYYVPCRLFEFLAGGVVGIIANNKVRDDVSRWWQIILFGILTFVVFSSLLRLDVCDIGTDIRRIGSDEQIEDGLLFPKSIALLLTVLLSTIVVYAGSATAGLKNRCLEYLGKRSYSLFIWHQIMIAYYRYFVSNEINLLFVIGFFFLLLCLSELSYTFVEKRIGTSRQSFYTTVFFSIIMIFAGGYVYVRAGVMRDVPELDIYKSNVHRGMHAEYVDRIYDYDKDFPLENGKRNVLIEGVSYGRDMANVILESDYKDSVNISYVFKWDKEYIPRIKKADYIFTFKRKDKVPDYVWKNLSPKAVVWGIGTKNYGQSNGVIYSKRFSPDYYNQTVKLHSWYKKTNDEWANSWEGHYINFIEIAMVGTDSIRVFTDDKKYISQDCYHLSPTGAKWYAKQIDFSYIFK